MRNRKLLVYFLLILAMFFWGGSYVWAKVALEYYNSITIIIFRLLVSAIAIFLFLIFTKQFVVPDKKHWALFLLLAFFEPFLYFIGETTGLSYVDPSTASVIVAMIPLFTPFVAYFFLNEQIRFLNLLGIIISICGICLLMFDKNMELQISGIGLALLSLSVISGNGYGVMIKKIPEKYSVLNITFWQNAIGMVYFIPLLAIFSQKDIFETGFVDIAFWAIVKLGIFASSLAFVFYMYGLRYMPITKANVFTNSIPVFTILISYFAYGEAIDMKKIVKILIIILGVIISQFRIKKFNKI
jgi:drug/metabolite transporter (DMT)-like permease